MDSTALAERVWFRLLRAQSRFGVAMSDRLRTLGLSVAQFDILSSLHEREGMTQKELAARLYVTKGNISGLIDRLEVAGLVERRPSAEDRRAHQLFLSGAGKETARQAMERQRAFIHETIGLLPADRLTDLESLLLELRDRVRQAGRLRRPDRAPTSMREDT